MTIVEKTIAVVMITWRLWGQKRSASPENNGHRGSETDGSQLTYG
jgi:hypothetical protein